MALSFQLKQSFLNLYKNAPVNFGYNGVGEVLYKRSYSREMPNRKKEEWVDTIARVVNGIYSIQKDHVIRNNTGWDEDKAHTSAQEMFDRFFTMKILPPGRGLFAMGTPIVHEKGLVAALYNCAMVSTKTIHREYSKPFRFLMDMSMLGVGVGFDTDGKDKLIIVGQANDTIQYAIPDSREGWVESTGYLIDSYFRGLSKPVFDYSAIRPKGAPIKTFGGVAPGPEPLHLLHNQINNVLSKRIGQSITSTDIVDLMNMIGCCVVSGNIRRSAEIAFGEIDDTEYLSLKDASKYPERNHMGTGWGWSSNNTVKALLGSNYVGPAKQTGLNGEPGYTWLENCRRYGRMSDPADNKDALVVGLNPCGEITLESYELCNLVEVYPSNHDTVEDFIRSLKYAYLYAKAVSLLPTHWPETNKVKLRNLRLGISQSGIVQAIEKLGINTYKNWLEQGYRAIQYYDEVYSSWLNVRKSIKLTTVKPSGSVSLLAGTTPGVHYPEDRFYIRRMRLDKDSELLNGLRDAGYHVEPDVVQPNTTVVAEFPVEVYCGRSQKEVSIWEKVMLANFMQQYWADNAVSVTIDFDPKTEANQIESILNYMQYGMKSISFLPRIGGNEAYAQLPYEAITQEKYLELVKGLKPLQLGSESGDGVDEKFCDGESCAI